MVHFYYIMEETEKKTGDKETTLWKRADLIPIFLIYTER